MWSELLKAPYGPDIEPGFPRKQELLAALSGIVIYAACGGEPHGLLEEVVRVYNGMNRNYLEDVCLSLMKHGVRRFCFVNHHVGNVPLIGRVAYTLKTDRLLRTEPKKVNAFPGVQVFCSISDLSDTAMIGDATKATREKGERIVEKALERMTEFLREW